MSLDLYQIGANLIHGDGIGEGLDGSDNPRDITDHISPGFGGTHLAAAALANAATGIVGEWGLTADAAEHFVPAAGRMPIDRSWEIPGFTDMADGKAGRGADGHSLESYEFALGGNRNRVGVRIVAASYDQARGADDLAWSGQYRDFADADFIKAIAAPYASPSALVMEQALPISRGRAFDAADLDAKASVENSGVFAANGAVTDDVAFDAVTFAGLLGHSQTDDWQSSPKMRATNGSELSFGTTGSLDRDGIIPYDFQDSSNGAGLALGGMTDAKLGSAAEVRSGASFAASFAAELANQAISPDEWFGLLDARGSDRLGKDPVLWVSGSAEDDPTASGSDGRTAYLHGIYGAPDELMRSLQNGLFDSRPMVFGLESDSGYLPSEVGDAAAYHEQGLTGVLHGLTPIDAEPKPERYDILHGLAGLAERFAGRSRRAPAPYSAPLAVGEYHAGGRVAAPEFDSVPMFEGDGFEPASAGSNGSQAAWPAEAEGSTFSSVPPGWLVALTSAVVMELTRNAQGDQAAPLGDSSARRQGQFAPSGTRGDPLHVRVVNGGVAYGTHMPVGPTANLPSQSLPIPGQVSFSP